MLRNLKYLIVKPRRIPFGICCEFSNNSKHPLETQNKPENENKSDADIVPKQYDPKSVTKEDLKWRDAWHEKEGQYYSVLRTFYRDDNNTGFVKRMSLNIEFTPSGIKKIFKESEEKANVMLHSYVPERNKILGDELAAAHYVVSRGGAIKFTDEDRWIKADENKKYTLPRFYDGNKILEAIDCSDMDIVYEGLANFRKLQKVKWLSFNGCDYIDDWCLDAIGNMFSDTVVYLDLRNCPKITYRGLGALAKMSELKILYIDDFFRATTFELTCLLLQELHPALEVKSDPVTFEIKRK